MFLLLLHFSFSYCQANISLEVLDVETGKPIPNAKVIAPDNTVVYTNDEGKVYILNNIKHINVSAPTYEELDFDLFETIIKLKPIYKDINEVQINIIDTKPIFQNTLKDYPKLYYSKPSIYSGTIKQKAYMNNLINNLLVADVDIWSVANAYNFKAVTGDSKYVE
ncbi:TPA: hypothetical protein NEG48_001142 [Elizabethkingia anophelis]|nr:hypothetical protein [Elizabethkingia anophelis]